MTDIVLIARLILVAVFLVAGITKLADLAGSRQAMIGFGLPEVLAKPAGLLLPLAELAIAIALIPTRTAWPASLAASALLLLFIGGIVVNLIRGRTPDCHCFGQLHSEPIGPGTIARNAVLLVPALFIAVAGRSDAGPSAIMWISRLGTSERVGLSLAVIVFALLLAQWSLLLHLMRQNGRLLLRIESIEAGKAAPAEPAAPVAGLAVGSMAPAFTLPGLHGETLTLPALLAQGNPALLLFTSPKCGPCAALMPDVARWQREARDRLTIALIAEGTVEANRAKASEYGLASVLVQDERSVSAAYEINGTPSAVLVGTDGTLARPMAVGGPAIRTLAEEIIGIPALALAEPKPAPTPVPAATPSNGNGAIAIGAAAPNFNLPDLEGHQVSLASLRGSDTLLLFWNTGCGFCRQMLDDLKAWEAQRPGDAPKIVVFSSGPIEDIRAMDLRSTVIPDPDFSYGPRFGATGTPMAVLLDSHTRVASSVAAGAPSVLALAGGGPPPDPTRVIPLQDQAPSSNGHHRITTGDPAPDFHLRDLSGKTIGLSSFRGHQTLLLFWNTGCGFCKKMLPDLKAWEAERTKDSPRLLVVSSGALDDMRAMELESPILVDEGFTTGPLFGANGTPMGILIDGQGRIASEMVVGADAVLTLARSVPASATS